MAIWFVFFFSFLLGFSCSTFFNGQLFARGIILNGKRLTTLETFQKRFFIRLEKRWKLFEICQWNAKLVKWRNKKKDTILSRVHHHMHIQPSVIFSVFVRFFFNDFYLSFSLFVAVKTSQCDNHLEIRLTLSHRFNRFIFYFQFVVWQARKSDLSVDTWPITRLFRTEMISREKSQLFDTFSI